MTQELLTALRADTPETEAESVQSSVSGLQDCGFAPPGAEEAKTQSPQPPVFRAGALKPGTEIGSRQGVQRAEPDVGIRNTQEPGSGDQERIATASERTGLAMTGFRMSPRAFTKRIAIPRTHPRPCTIFQP